MLDRSPLCTSLVEEAVRTLFPEVRLSVDEWADRYRVLDRMTAAEPGQWRTSRTPYLRQPMQDFTNPDVEDIVLVASTQVGKTESILNMLGYAVDQDPGAAMVVLPREEDAKAWGQKRCRSALENSPRLAMHLTGKEDDLLGKLFKLDRMYVKFAGANSPGDLVSDPCRYVFFDEVEKYPRFSGKDSTPLRLGRKRTTTFLNRKIVEASTPTLEEGPIWQSLMTSQFHRYFVCCPLCNVYQAIGFRRQEKIGWSKARHGTLCWPKGVKAKDFEGGAVPVWMECAGCGQVVEESHKSAMVEAGVWCPEGSDVQGGQIIGESRARMRRGYHIPAMISPWVSWGELAAEFLGARDEPEGLMSFVNNSLAEPYQHKTVLRVDSHPLVERREVFESAVPNGVLFLTCGVDIQMDRIEYEVIGWGEDFESWSIEYDTIWGRTTERKVWKELDKKLGKVWNSSEGIPFGIVRTFIDSSAFTGNVYSFVRPRQVRQVFAVKGEDGAGRPVAVLSRAQIRSTGMHLYILGVDSIKDIVFGSMGTTEPGPTYMHFPMYEEDYFLMLTAERPTVVYRKGFAVRSYEKIRDRNEALDCRVYGYAAAYSLKPDWEDLAKRMAAHIDDARGNAEARRPEDVETEMQELTDGADPSLTGVFPSDRIKQEARARRSRKGFVKRW